MSVRVLDEFHQVTPEISVPPEHHRRHLGRRKRLIVVTVLPVNPTLLLYRSRGREKCKEEGRCRLCERPDTRKVNHSTLGMSEPEYRAYLREQRALAPRPLTRHHLIPDVWFRDAAQRAKTVETANEWMRLRDVDSNIVPLCRLCHDVVELVDDHGRRLLRKMLGQNEIAFMLQVRGQEWLDLRYPSLA